MACSSSKTMTEDHSTVTLNDKTESKDMTEEGRIQIGNFNDKTALSLINEPLQFVEDLDILTSQIEPFTDPKNHWVPSMALFHYTVKHSEIEWDSDHALILTIADLFCNAIPQYMRSESNRSRESLMETARKYIQEMKSYQMAWSKITPDEYKAALDLYPKWPMIEDPFVDSDGDEVELANLMQAFAFCFKQPSASATLKIRSGLWAIIIASATNGTIRSEVLERTTAELSDALGQRLSIAKPLFEMIVDHVLGFISADDLFENLICSFNAEKVRRVKFVIGEATWSSLPELKTVITAVERFNDFDWNCYSYGRDAFSVQEDLRKLMSNSRIFMKNPGAFDPNEYGTLAFIAKELLIRMNFAKVSDFDDWSIHPKRDDEETLLRIAHYINNPNKERQVCINMFTKFVYDAVCNLRA